ncbi:MAG: Hydantoin racemase [uncultured Solirubrobacteraceae bacterium]|uniref:Hydantoin racemase n=1 Tax=uncultured Solirubrobacteraceae bacterium TaxID=1162706 RepID=A0A6J4RIR7_9ACTN|nr:MAG: Hydantoin racemase [uncultured Solirubrobacteraceae bacterium]
MRILVINPNTTEAMTRGIEAQALRYARPDTVIEAVSPSWGPASIEGHVEEELAAVATLQTIAERGQDFDGIVIACYGDPGLYAARELATVPVIGIAEASMLLACTVAHSFSIVSTLHRVKPILEDLVRKYGFEARCASVRTTPLAVLDLERDPGSANTTIIKESRRAIEEDGAEAILLGCAGMGPLDDRRIQAELGVPVIDGVVAAVKLMEGLGDYPLGTSRAAAFKEPEEKEFKGQPERLLESIAGRMLAPDVIATSL